MSLILSGTNGLSDVDGSAATPAIRGTDTNTGIFFPAADTIAFAEGGVEAMRLDSSGNLGLGVTPSAWSGGKVLEFQNGQSLNSFSNTLYVGSNTYYNGTNYIAKVTGGASLYGVGQGTHIWYNAASVSAGSTQTLTQAMTLDASGNLGLGTTSPTAILDARGTFAVGPAVGMARIRRNTVSGSNGLTIQGNANDTVSDTNPGAYIAVGGGPLTDGYEGSINLVAYGATTDNNRNQIIFSNRSGVNTVTERARIDSSGNLLVGRTSTFSTPGGDTPKIYSAGALGVIAGTTVSAYSSDRINFNASTYFVLGSSTGGGVKLDNGTTAWAAQSDETTKDIIEPIDNAIGKVDSLRAVIGKYKEDVEGTRRSFLIAQDVQAVLPEAVSTSSDGLLSLRYTEVIPLLVAAIQEQQAMIASQSAIITQLQADVANVRSELTALKGQA
jgi:hypothetical protein